MFKVNNKNTRMTSFSSVSIFDFEQDQDFDIIFQTGAQQTFFQNFSLFSSVSSKNLWISLLFVNTSIRGVFNLVKYLRRSFFCDIIEFQQQTIFKEKAPSQTIDKSYTSPCPLYSNRSFRFYLSRVSVCILKDQPVMHLCIQS